MGPGQESVEGVMRAVNLREVFFDVGLPVRLPDTATSNCFMWFGADLEDLVPDLEPANVELILAVSHVEADRFYTVYASREDVNLLVVEWDFEHPQAAVARFIPDSVIDEDFFITISRWEQEHGVGVRVLGPQRPIR